MIPINEEALLSLCRQAVCGDSADSEPNHNQAGQPKPKSGLRPARHSPDGVQLCGRRELTAPYPDRNGKLTKCLNYFLDDGSKNPLEHRVYQTWGKISTAITVAYHPWIAIPIET